MHVRNFKVFDAFANETWIQALAQTFYQTSGTTLKYSESTRKLTSLASPEVW